MSARPTENRNSRLHPSGRSYVVTIGEREFQVELYDTPDGQVRVRVDERDVQLELRPSSPPFVTGSVNGERLFAAGSVREGVLQISLRGELLVPEVEDRRARLLRRAGGSARQSAHEQVVKAPMPGLVVNVPVAAGDVLTRGACVVVLQAMKMENELRVAADGEVAEVRVSVGQTVEQGQVLVVLR